MLQDSPFPNFDRVQAEHVVPGIKALLTQLGQEIDDLEQNVTASWQGLLNPLERISDRLSRAWGTISHLKAVKDSEALRKAYEEVSFAHTTLGRSYLQSRGFLTDICRDIHSVMIFNNSTANLLVTRLPLADAEE